jgi:hypothetical protein
VTTDQIKLLYLYFKTGKTDNIPQNLINALTNYQNSFKRHENLVKNFIDVINYNPSSKIGISLRSILTLLRVVYPLVSLLDYQSHKSVDLNKFHEIAMEISNVCSDINHSSCLTLASRFLSSFTQPFGYPKEKISNNPVFLIQRIFNAS